MYEIRWGTKKYNVPEYVIYRGKKYDYYTGHADFKDVVRGWAKSDRILGRVVIIKAFKSTDGKGTLYQLYRNRSAEGPKVPMYGTRRKK